MKKISIIIVLLCVICPVSVFAWTPNDPYLSYQWHFDTIGVKQAWDYNRGGRSDVKVAVIDTGVAWNLSDFNGTRFDWGNAWDWISWDGTPNDPNGHGTHVAGTIAQSTNNGHGTAGIAFNTTILPLRVMSANGSGSTSAIADAINWAVYQGADIINLSLGTVPWYNSWELSQACLNAYYSGVLVVAAAGNSGSPFLDNPAAYPGVLAVGAVDMRKNLAYYSNYSYYMILAPGGDTRYDRNRDGYIDGILQQSIYGDFWFEQGTSMAAPHVTGTAALILSEAYDLGLAIPARGSDRVDWLAGVIGVTAEDLGSYGPDSVYGFGLVRADWALNFMPALANANPNSGGDMLIQNSHLQDWTSLPDPASYGHMLMTGSPIPEDEQLLAKDHK
ncbi:MAG: S8 family serine peptidase [Desulfarculaceae bacterium]|jgi:serine protease